MNVYYKGSLEIKNFNSRMKFDQVAAQDIEKKHYFQRKTLIRVRFQTYFKIDVSEDLSFLLIQGLKR